MLIYSIANHNNVELQFINVYRGTHYELAHFHFVTISLKG